MTPAVRDCASLSAQRILVVAPHPDDESLGCGGLILSLAGLGRAFHVVFVTDGGASHLKSREWPRERLRAEREKEAAEALKLLGIAEAPRSFLRLRDADMPKPGSEDHASALAAASGIVAAFKPDLVLLPWRRDPHCDHRDSWRLFVDALEAETLSPDVLEYAIWLDEIGNPDDHPRPGEMERVAFDISRVVPAKRAAVAAHLSQTTDLIADDPDAFRLTPETIDRLAGPVEAYWKECR